MSDDNKRKSLGKLGEAFFVTMLSRKGYEAFSPVPELKGIDVFAHNATKHLGISVKTRIRVKNSEKEQVYLFRKEKDRQNFIDICKLIQVEPYLGIYVETESEKNVYLTSLEHYDKKYRILGKKIEVWEMTEKNKREYENDPEVEKIW